MLLLPRKRNVARNCGGVHKRRICVLIRMLWLLQWASLSTAEAAGRNKNKAEQQQQKTKNDPQWESKILFMRSSNKRPSKTKSVLRVDDVSGDSADNGHKLNTNTMNDNDNPALPATNQIMDDKTDATGTPFVEINLLDKDDHDNSLGSARGNDSSSSAHNSNLAETSSSSSSSSSPFDEQRYSSTNAFVLSMNSVKQKGEDESRKDQCPKEAVRCDAKRGLCDHNENCREWAWRGECEDSVDYMSEDCRLSCLEFYLDDTDSLDADLDGPSLNVKLGKVPVRCDPNDPNLCDYEEWCDEWSKRGECSVQKSYMRRECSYACNEIIELCDFWADEGECEGNAKYMLDVCSEACKRLGSAMSTPTLNDSSGPSSPSASTVDSTTGELEHFRCNEKQTQCDHDKYCGKWAARGDCSRNREFMLGKCAFSCHLRTQ